MTVDIRVPATATREEAMAIRLALETLLKQKASAALKTSAWAAAARREALDDRAR